MVLTDFKPEDITEGTIIKTDLTEAPLKVDSVQVTKNNHGNKVTHYLCVPIDGEVKSTRIFRPRFKNIYSIIKLD